jgi:branched-chain amino acid transport system permease protein
MLRRLRVLPPVLVVLAVLLPLVSGSDFDLSRYDVLWLYICVAIGLNMSLGYAGEFALGQVFVMAAAAYSAGMLSAHLGWDVWATIPAALVTSAIAGIVVHLPGLRLAGWTLAFVGFLTIIVLPEVLVMGQRWTGGEDGLLGIHGVGIGGDVAPAWVIYEVVLGCTVLTWVAQRNLVRSGWGLRLRGLRDSPRGVEAAGVSILGTKLAAYVMSAVPAGLAGALMVHVNQFVDPSTFGFNLLALLLAGVILGGRGSLWGPVIGTGVLQAFSLWVGPFSEYNVLILGLALLVVIVAFPRGLVPSLHAVLERSPVQRGSMRDTAERAGLPEIVPRASTVYEGESQDVLCATGIVRSFGGNRALDDVDVRLRPGRMVGLIGPNGSGKTTFINVVTGFLEPDAGRIEIEGRPVGRRGANAIARLGVARTFQVPQLIDELSVRENVEVGLVGMQRQHALGALLRTPAFRRREAERAERAGAVCQWLGFDDLAVDSPAGQLPLGLKRIVEIGRAVVAEPALICLDEPAAGLNPAEIEWLGVILDQLRTRGHTILLVEHNVGFVVAHCDEVYLLESGRVVSHAGDVRGAELPDRLRAYVELRPRRALVESAGIV